MVEQVLTYVQHNSMG